MSAATAGGPVPRDPGRQPERTRLAWRRTVLTVTVVALLGARLAIQLPTDTQRLLTVAAVLAGWLAASLVSWRRIAAMAAPEPVPVRWAVPLTTLATLGLAGLGLVLVTTV
jgi:uncharacterized membrane protein YidH (DUF202 family)